MSYIDNTRKDFGSPFEQTVCLTQGDCKVLLPLFKKVQKKLESKYEKYKDIQDGGESTTRQQNLLYKYENEMEQLDSLLSNINHLLK